MVRLLRDRYFAYDELHGCDLATGEVLRLEDLPDEEDLPVDLTMAPLGEILDHGRDGDPRWVVVEARNSVQAAALAHRAAVQARRKGYVPVLADLYMRLWDALAAEVRERALLLIAGVREDASPCGGALIRAVAHSPRPHVLMTFRTTSPIRGGSRVREARVVYGIDPARESSSQAGTIGAAHASVRPVPAEVVKQLQRAKRAVELQRAGRHAAAERLLREVASALTRRSAFEAAAGTLVALGRLRLERGRVRDADDACSEAARMAEALGDGREVVEARLGQVAARTDAGRLVEAEALCRALLLAGPLSPFQRGWATAALARTLLWQGRVEEAAGLDLVSFQVRVSAPRSTAADVEPTSDQEVVAWIQATTARVLLAAGDVFEAGRRVRALLADVARCVDPLPRVIALTAHLRQLVATGDLTLAEESFRRGAELARQARTLLRAAGARLIWHDGLRHAGLMREAKHELDRLSRVGRVVPPLLRRAIEHRLASDAPVPRGTIGPQRQKPASIALALVQLTHEEEDETRALRRILERVADELQTSRVDFLSADAGPVSTLLSAGAGPPTHLGPRVLEAGIVLPVEVQHGGREIGIPVRLGTRLLAALVGRWPIDREPPPHATELLRIASAVAAPRIAALLTDAREMARASTSIPELVGVSGAMAEVRRAIERAAAAPFAVLIEGESGVGKELVARAIHQLSPRRERRFCDVNCAALPDDLLESELFGHARGAFTGTVADRAGLFEEAHGGTLFLDELSDLSPRGQAKLLRVLQQHEIRRVGETFSRKVDVRVVTATNRDLPTEITEGRFRRDLSYRLDVIRIRIPQLRDRPEDVPVLAQHFWRAAAARVGSRATLTHGVIAALARYHWPGNIRELQNVIAALAVAAPPRGPVGASLLPAAITGATSVSSRRLAAAREQFERRCIEVALAQSGGNRARAAVELGLSRQGLHKTMARLGLDGGVGVAPRRREL